eukprot:gene785-976_t
MENDKKDNEDLKQLIESTTTLNINNEHHVTTTNNSTESTPTAEPTTVTATTEATITTESTPTAEPATVTATTTEPTETATTTPIKRTTTTLTQFKRTLKHLLHYKLISLESKSYFKYKDIVKDVEIFLGENDEPYFRIKLETGEFISEQSSSTLIKKYLNLPTNIDGNKYMYIDGKKMSDFESPLPSENGTIETPSPQKIVTTPTRTTSSSNLGSVTPNTPISSDNNIPSASPGGPTPFKVQSLQRQNSNFLQSQHSYEFFKQDSFIMMEDSPMTIEYEQQPAKIKPSGLGRYFHFGCERYLSFSTRSTSTTNSTNPTNNNNNNNDQQQQITQDKLTLVQDAVRKYGFVWEEQLLDHLKKIDPTFKMITPTPPATNIPQAEALKVLKEEKGPFYLIQGTLEPPNSFRKSLPKFITFSISIPDYLRVLPAPPNGKRVLQILDAKSTSSVTFSQKIQLAFYYLLLNEIIFTEEIGDLEVSKTAGIYLKGNYELQEFDLLETISVLSSFMFGDHKLRQRSQLWDILTVPKEQSPWVISQRCEGCEYLGYCTQQAAKEQNLNSVSGIDPNLKNLLPPQPVLESNNTTEVEYLFTLPEEKVTDLPLRTLLVQAKPRLESTIRNEPLLTGYKDVRLAQKYDVHLYMSLTQDPVSQTLYRWDLKSIVEGEKSYYYSGTLIKDLVVLLSNILSGVAQEEKSLQCFMFDVFEKSFFFHQCIRLLKHQKETLTSEEEIEKTLLVLRSLMYSSAEWIGLNLNHYPDSPVPYSFGCKNQQDTNSFVLIQEQVQKSYALNINPTYTLEKIVDCLFSETHDCLDGDLIYTKITNQEDIKPLTKQRLDILSDIIQLLKSVLFPSSNSNPAPPFKIRPILKFKDQNLNKLYFCYQSECLAQYNQIKSRRSYPLYINQLEGKFLLLKLLNCYEVKKPRSIKHQVDFNLCIHKQLFSQLEFWFENQFRYTFITPYNEEGMNGLINLNEILYTFIKRPLMEEIKNIRMEILDEVGNGMVQVKLTCEVSTPGLFSPDKYGTHFLLFEMFNIKYFSQHKNLVEAYFDISKQHETHPLLNFLNHPLEWMKPVGDQDYQTQMINLSKEVINAFEQCQSGDANSGFKNKLTMTPSQSSIFQSILHHRMQLVRGPPGTGKTHFLALVVLIFMECYQRKGLPFSVAISALTHTAIDTLLIRIAQLKREYEMTIGTSLNFHLVKRQSDPLSTDLSSHGVEKYTEVKKYFCLGSTSWGLNSIKCNTFNMLIIDEASQLHCPTSVLAFQCLHPTEGRVIVCGDSKQLGPVLKDSYPTRKDVVVDSSKLNPKLQKSIFSCFKDLLTKAGATNPWLTLSENFRMNLDLCSFSSRSLYGDHYRCFDRNQQTLSPYSSTNSEGNEHSPLIQSIFSDPRSCITVLLDDKDFGNKEIECEIVKEIYRYLKSEYSKSIATETPAEVIETNFWKQSKILGVITPLHEQRLMVGPGITTIQQQEWNLQEPIDPTVNTVETMQGQEFDNIVVCYNGWNENNKKNDFSFNLNRLNVSFTRAKKKLILIVSSYFLNPDEVIFNNKKMSRAYKYLKDYIEYSSVHRFKTTKSIINQQKMEQTNTTTITSENSVSDLTELFMKSKITTEDVNK